VPRRELWVAGVTIAVGLVIIAALVVNGLIQEAQSNGGGQAGGALVEVPTGPLAVPDENGVIACHQALMTGPLIAHPRWGITVGGAPGEAPPVFWPNGYVARDAGDHLELLNDRGQVVARTGDIVSAAGGQGTINGMEGFIVCPVGIEFQRAAQ
jgi:hypothetical protein